jgi:hypothetical protein
MFSGAAAPRQDAGARLLLNLISEDPRQRPFVKTGFLPDLIAHLRQLKLPGFNATNVGSVPDKLPPCVRVLFAADPNVTIPGDGGGVFTMLVKEVSKVSCVRRPSGIHICPFFTLEAAAYIHTYI